MSMNDGVKKLWEINKDLINLNVSAINEMHNMMVRHGQVIKKLEDEISLLRAILKAKGL